MLYGPGLSIFVLAAARHRRAVAAAQQLAAQQLAAQQQVAEAVLSLSLEAARLVATAWAVAAEVIRAFVTW